MSLPQGFLDELRARVPISSLIGRAVKLTKAGREFKACCPFHSEKTPSFTVSDEKGFGHCFGCGWHGDAFRWLQDHDGIAFMDAVRELAGLAGLEVPAPGPEAGERARQAETLREALEAAQAVFAAQLEQTGAVMEYLAGRCIGPAEIAAFGIGYARGGTGSLAGRGIGSQLGQRAGLLVPRTDGQGMREAFWDRITIPIHDRRGRLCGFGGRVWPGRRSQEPKFVNSPDGELFDKGRLLFNHHRAAPASRPQAENRLIVVEGYFDVIAMTRAGFSACVAPMGTALTEAQLELCWRMHHRPVLLFDGDAAGRSAARRACELAMPALGPGRELAVALLPQGRDPDDVLREADGARAVAAALTEAAPVHGFLFDAVRASGHDHSPEAIAGVWAALENMARRISDEETRAQYLGVWRARFEREISAAPQLAADEPVHAVIRTEDGDYAFPESEGDSAARLIALVRAVLKRREERRAITEEIGELMKMAELAGFQKKAITAAVQDIESDLKHGPARREEDEMQRALYRRVLGIRGPMDEAMLPQMVDARPRQVGAAVKRRMAMHALVDAQAGRI